MLTKWYPYDKDPQFGVFIQKQARAISLYKEIVVYASHAHDEAGRPAFELQMVRSGDLTEYIMYYRKSRSFLSPLINAIHYIRAWNKSFTIIHKNHGIPETVHAYILLRPAIIAYRLSRRFRIPLVISEQWSGYTNGKFEQRLCLIRILSKYFFKKADERIAVSNFLKSSMEKLGFSKPINIVPNIIEIQDPPESLTRNDKIQILLVADLVDEIKNISGTIRAFTEAKKSMPNIYLKIIGHGKDAEMLKDLCSTLQLTEENIKFEGLQSNKEVYKALWNCDFLLMNSRFETFSLICAEALSCGKPVVATKCGGPESFINEDNGLLIPINDDAALCSAIIYMAENYQNYSPEKLREQSRNKFSPETVGAQLCTIYNKIN